MSYLDERRKFIEDGRPLPAKKKHIIPKKSAKRIQKEKQQGIEIVKPKQKAGWFDLQKAINEEQQPTSKVSVFVPTEEELNSSVEFVSPTPEYYDAERVQIKNDEISVLDKSSGVDESFQNLMNDLDQVLSLLIRHKYADKNGMVKCFTCPVVLPIKEIQNGHYCKRTHKSTRNLESNCRPQCPNCNRIHNENEKPYTEALERETPGITEWLKEQSKLIFKPSRQELKRLLIEYRSKLEILMKKINQQT